MTTNYKYRVYCTTDNKNKYTDWTTTTPTVCPTGAHGIDTTKTSIIEVQGPKSVDHETIVSNNADYPGDYTSISDAFNGGATSVHVKNGVYFETSDIVIPNGGQLRGELPGQTIIVFIGAYSIKIDGSGGTKETAGTISCTHNTSIVTGSGTSLNNLSVGDFILIGTNYYEILTVDSATQVTLKETYVGNSISASTYIAQSMYTGNSISNLIITGSSGTGVYIRALRHGGVKSIAIAKCAPCITIVDCGDLSINEVIPTFSTGIGFTATDCVSLSLHTVNVFNCSSHGFEVGGTNIIAESCAAENNDGCGFHVLGGSKFINVNDSVIKFNDSMGLKFESTSICNTVSNTEISNNNGIGLDIQNANNNVNSCFIINNIGIGILGGLENVIEGNTIIDNTGDGIKLPSGADSCVICDNSLKNNTGIGVNVLSSRSGVCSNNIKSSGEDGIYIGGIKNKISDNTIENSSEIGINISPDGDNCIVSGNISDLNTGDGFLCATGALNTIITSNNFLGNTGTNYVNYGTSTVSANNITS